MYYLVDTDLRGQAWLISIDIHLAEYLSQNNNHVLIFLIY